MIPQLELIWFIALAGVTVIAALGVIFSRTAVYSVLSLLVNFGALAVLYLMLNAQFLAAVQILVYAGAIVVLFLFVQMLLGTGDQMEPVHLFDRRTVPAVAAALVFLTLVGTVVYEGAIGGERGTATPDYIAEVGQTQAIGAVLFTDYLLAFEFASVLMLVGIVGAIVLAQQRQATTRDKRSQQRED